MIICPNSNLLISWNKGHSRVSWRNPAFPIHSLFLTGDRPWNSNSLVFSNEIALPQQESSTLADLVSICYLTTPHSDTLTKHTTLVSSSWCGSSLEGTADVHQPDQSVRYTSRNSSRLPRGPLCVLRDSLKAPPRPFLHEHNNSNTSNIESTRSLYKLTVVVVP